MLQNVCLVCEETVTNQICSTCLQTTVISWLENKHSELIPEVVSMDDLFYAQGALSVNCILCGGSMTVCVECYYQEIQNLLFRCNPDAGHEFLKFFNFEPTEKRGELMKGWYEALEHDDFDVLRLETEELDNDELELREAAFMQGYEEAYLVV